MSDPIDLKKVNEATTETAHAVQPDDLHDLFAVNPNYDGPAEEDPLAALRNDPNYSALIRDLEYIAKQARMLFEPAAETPADSVWSNIQSKLKSENPDS